MVSILYLKFRKVVKKFVENFYKYILRKPRIIVEESNNKEVKNKFPYLEAYNIK